MIKWCKYIVLFHIINMLLLSPLYAVKVYPPSNFRPISSLRFSPPRYYVGDTVQLNFQFDLDPKTEIFLPLYEKNKIFDVSNITYERTKHTVQVNVELRIFFPGTRSIQFNFGDVNVSVPLNVSSVFDGNYMKKEMTMMAYGPMMLKGTKILLIFLMGLLVLLPICTYFLIKFFKRMLVYRKFLITPRRRFFREIKVLSSNGAMLSDKVFYTRLLGSFRLFLARHFSRDEFETATTHIMVKLFLEYYNEDETKMIMSLMHRGDLIKFGGAVMQENERVESMKQITFLVKKLFTRAIVKNDNV